MILAEMVLGSLKNLGPEGLCLRDVAESDQRDADGCGRTKGVRVVRAERVPAASQIILGYVASATWIAVPGHAEGHDRTGSQSDRVIGSQAVSAAFQGLLAHSGGVPLVTFENEDQN